MKHLPIIGLIQVRKSAGDKFIKVLKTISNNL